MAVHSKKAFTPVSDCMAGRKWSAGLVALMLSVLMATGFVSSASAQVISQPSQSGAFTGTFIGQSFTANFTGTVTQIAVKPAAGAATTLYLYNGAGTGAANAAGAFVSSQPVTLIDQSVTNNFQVITLATPLPVTSGQVYSFAFGSASLTAAVFASEYPGGGSFTNGTTLSANDLTFQIFNTPPAPTPVPTLSEWAMILFGLMLAGGAALVVQRRKFA